MSTAARTTLPSALDDWLERLRLIPDQERSFDVDLHTAQQTFGIDAPLAHELIARGLPHAPTADGPRFCTTDLHYVGLRLDTAMTHRTAMRLWAAALADAATRAETHVEVRCSPYGRPGDEVQVLVPPGTWERATIAPNRRATSFEVRTPGRWPPFDDKLHDLLNDVATLDFCLMPGDLYGSAEFARTTRLADCGSAAFLLAEECRRLGVEARTSFGLLLARPYATPHHWTDILTGDTWVPADPLLLALLAQTTELDASDWPPTRSPGSVLVRIADRQVPLARSAATDDPLEASFLVKLRESA
jgi:transglutaminase superfamily protein